MARNDPQVNLRMPADLKDRLDEAAQKNKRSLTAEIVDRLDVYDAIWANMAEMASEHDKLVGELEATKAALHEQKVSTRALQALLQENLDEDNAREDARRQVDSVIEKRYNDMVEQRTLLEGLKEELAHLSHARGDSSGETERLLRQQAEMIDQLRRTQELTEKTIMQFRDAFLDAESGDDKAFERLVEMFQRARNKAAHDPG